MGVGKRWAEDWIVEAAFQKLELGPDSACVSAGDAEQSSALSWQFSTSAGF